MDKQREMFEAWADGKFGGVKSCGEKEMAWDAWQAALAEQRSQFVADTGIDLKGMVDAGFEANNGRAFGFTAQPAVPDGYALVPIEATEEMEEAGFDAYQKYQQLIKEKVFPRPTLMTNVYNAMLAAAK